jgi:hypothetical protein
MSVILISNVKGKIPTVSQLLTTDIGMGYNRVDGLLFALRISGNSKQVICIGASINPSDIHARLHDIDSIDDHNTVGPEKRGKYLATDPENGSIVFLSGLIPEGEKHTGIDAGKFGEAYLSDDYVFYCVKTGTAGNAIWKKTSLHQT